jgi:hypothetical protein
MGKVTPILSVLPAGADSEAPALADGVAGVEHAVKKAVEATTTAATLSPNLAMIPLL